MSNELKNAWAELAQDTLMSILKDVVLSSGGYWMEGLFKERIQWVVKDLIRGATQEIMSQLTEMGVVRYDFDSKKYVRGTNTTANV